MGYTMIYGCSPMLGLSDQNMVVNRNGGIARLLQGHGLKCLESLEIILHSISKIEKTMKHREKNVKNHVKPPEHI